MRINLSRQRQLQLCGPEEGDFPDDGIRDAPDGPYAGLGLDSGMTALSESNIFTPAGETGWNQITLLETRATPFAFIRSWRPAVNAYRDSDQFVVFIDLAGVPPESIEVSAQSRRLIVRGTRPPPEPGCNRSDLMQLLALEIDHGAFERVLDLPQAIEPARITTGYCDGLFRIQLPLAS